MKNRRALVPARDDLANQFLRGMVSAGLLAAAQQQCLTAPEARKQVLARALQGGTALASGVAAANALQRGRAGQAVVAVALGAAGLAGIEYLLKKTRTGKGAE
ncbi:MAG: hypothetical protein CGU28_13425 [Candidatus Dactylopiibacterium carminicum]|uniref:Uncharacterized protein n=1 Tax=Candidatus Dactylopiibacterium carminicum TaxID=857335 RepID=A0A272EP39_9RHOO|nr:hypothetical protein [Candidatus Dactylopiibacterium carminicum]KAF7598221.1 hypothetical protein BGI27_14500 [Candidatus Dactylopiibacterium carminicum]PAS91873.1 MAG: hypothetical protein CGU29_14120 [Candidatus Dactylopiibacterium carminicum]PAS94848.1 MAG: hypothetical protein CGU28_13425 [Candidatus Dactylopiibacterium carminicum]PAS97015.1 MAG: hypothetical protein BSR46_14535 [Candidatus Dactylopiibacterium carminicum]